MTESAQDSVLAGCLISSPAWAPLLASCNVFLTTVTLVIGLIIGLLRLWLVIRSSGKDK